MKAVICTKYGSPEVLQIHDVKKPEPGDNELLIKICSTVATTASIPVRVGKPVFVRLFLGLRKPRNDIPGQEIAGIVVETGKDVNSFGKGDEIIALAGVSMGAQAEYKCIPEDSVVTNKPGNVTFDEAVSTIEGGLTAINFLKHKAKIQHGQKVLIYGASGSVGTAAVQIARHFGAEVTAVCSTANLELAKSLGANEVIDYVSEDFTQNGKVYDIIFDTVGKSSFGRCKKSLTTKGVYLDTAGLNTILSMIWTSLFSRKKAIFATTYVGRKTKEIQHDLITVKELVEQGAIKPVIDRRYNIDDIVEAYKYVEKGHKKGNVIISVLNENFV